MESLILEDDFFIALENTLGGKGSENAKYIMPLL